MHNCHFKIGINCTTYVESDQNILEYFCTKNAVPIDWSNEPIVLRYMPLYGQAFYPLTVLLRFDRVNSFLSFYPSLHLANASEFSNIYIKTPLCWGRTQQCCCVCVCVCVSFFSLSLFRHNHTTNHSARTIFWGVSYGTLHVHPHPLSSLHLPATDTFPPFV